MVKKVTTPASEKQLTQTVKDSANQIWLAGLGAFSKTQEEGNKVFDALVKEGEAIQKKTREAADKKISGVREAADGRLAGVRKAVDAKVSAVTGKVSAVTDKASDKWDRLEQVFEDRVARALSSLGVPSKKDIDKLTKRIAELTALVQKMSDAQEGKNSISPPPGLAPRSAARGRLVARARSPSWTKLPTSRPAAHTIDTARPVSGCAISPTTVNQASIPSASAMAPSVHRSARTSAAGASAEPKHSCWIATTSPATCGQVATGRWYG